MDGPGQTTAQSAVRGEYDWSAPALLLCAARLLEHRMNECLEPLQLTASALAALSVVAQGGPVTQGSLADLLHLRSQSARPVLARLEDLGYVTTHRELHDLRSKKFLITNLGLAALDESERCLEAVPLFASTGSDVLRTELSSIIRVLVTMHRSGSDVVGPVERP